MLLDGKFKGLSVREAFSKNIDGEQCPIANCYAHDEFFKLCQQAGFKDTRFQGGYLSDTELDCMHRFAEAAINVKRFAQEHKDFILI